VADTVSPLFLLDTNICIYLLGGTAGHARMRVEQCTPGEIAASAITLAEVMVGARTLNAVAQTQALFEVVTIIPFDQAAATAYASLPFKRGSYDRLIAAHALSMGLTLVTNNSRDFSRIEGLKVENWARE
jgi:tRNA(fMet)-specific endonuclease VapC